MPQDGFDPRVIFDFVERVATLDDVDAILGAFRHVAITMGISIVAVGELPALGEIRLPSFFVSTWPEAWSETYIAEGFVASDPTVPTARMHPKPVLWSDMKKAATTENRRVIDAASVYGWNEGMVIPFHGPDAYCGIVSMAGETTELQVRERAALHFMGLYLHERLRDLLAPRLALPTGPRLSRGEIECIRWLVAGKSDWEMSEILNISEAAVHWRIERAKKKFGVKTRAQLTALAVYQGYVQP